MYWVLVSRGVVSGLCLVFAKYWYDRWEKDQELNATVDNSATESACRHGDYPLASVSGLDVRAPSAVSSAAAVATPTGPFQRDTATKAGIFKAHDRHPPAAVSSNAADTPTCGASTAVPADPIRRKTRQSIDDEQRVEQALAAGDLRSMDTLLADICDPVLRNRLMNRLVTGYYRLRADSGHRAALYRVADLQIDEASSILDGMEEIGQQRPDTIEAFKSMAIALDEDGRQDSAIAICELALSLGLQDGTKSGFEGRISRLKKRQMHTGAPSPETLVH